MPEDSSRPHTSKINALIRAMDDLDMVLSQEPRMPALPNPVQAVNPILPPPVPSFVHAIQLELLFICFLHFLILLRIKQR